VYFLLFLLASGLYAFTFGQKIRANNTLAKRKSKQCTGQKEEQTIHWPKGRADNTLTKRKSRQYTDQKEEQTMCIVCTSFWPVYCLLFLLASVLSALPFGQCIVCSSFWPVLCLLFLLASALFALPFGQCIVCSKEEQTIN
jgi:magnesium-transporting ATPase (P-type)